MLLTVNSFIRGYHEYMDHWEPNAEDEFLLKREPDNVKDSNAVAVVQAAKDKACISDQCQATRVTAVHPNNLNDEFDVIGHVPKLMAMWLTKFLKRPLNSAKVIVKGKRVNRGGGYGLEVPCQYHFQGDNFSCKWLHEKLIKEEFHVQCCEDI